MKSQILFSGIWVIEYLEFMQADIVFHMVSALFLVKYAHSCSNKRSMVSGKPLKKATSKIIYKTITDYAIVKGIQDILPS